MNYLRYPPLVIGLVLCVSGCGPRIVNVKGVVKLDDAPVEGATVAFVSEDGKSTYTGFTDAGGNFTLLSSDNKSGAPPGKYKITVTKRSGVQGGEEKMTPGSPEYLKAMQKEQKEAAAGGPKIKMPGMPPGMKMPGMPNMSAPGVKSELPAIYATVEKTPLEMTVPSDKYELNLKSKS